MSKSASPREGKGPLIRTRMRTGEEWRRSGPQIITASADPQTRDLCERVCRLSRPQTSSKDPSVVRVFYSLPSDPGIRVRRSFMSGKREGTVKSALCPYVAVLQAGLTRGADGAGGGSGSSSRRTRVRERVLATCCTFLTRKTTL